MEALRGAEAGYPLIRRSFESFPMTRLDPDSEQYCHVWSSLQLVVVGGPLECPDTSHLSIQVSHLIPSSATSSAAA
jgi:hypothetical protein